MKNSKLVHEFRSSLIDFLKTQDIAQTEEWVIGFNSSFTRDYDSIEYTRAFERVNTDKPFEQQKKVFELAFKAGLMLREAVEEYQKDYPKEDKFSDWCK